MGRVRCTYHGRMFRDLVTRRLRQDAATPLVTCYGATPGERTEFSTRSFANWVDKTANLVVAEYDLGEGDTVVVRVLAEHPHQWMGWVWLGAAWQVGLRVRTAGAGDLVVGGPDIAADPRAVATLACSLDPLGTPLRATAPGVVDYVGEVRGQPDTWLGVDPSPDAELWEDRTWADLVVDRDDARRLVRAATPESARDALLAALPAGSVVVVPATWDDAGVARIGGVEKVA